MTSNLGPQERKALYTFDTFTAMTNRIEVKVTPSAAVDTSNAFPVNRNE